MAPALAEADLGDALPRIGVPTLLMYDDKGVRAPLTVAGDLQANISGSRLVVLPGVGHMKAPRLQIASIPMSAASCGRCKPKIM